MSEPIEINPTWRSGSRFTIYRDPDHRARSELFSDTYKSVRFVYSGRSLYAGRAYEFTHGDMHTGMKDFWMQTAVWDGELFLIRDWEKWKRFSAENPNDPPHIILDVNPTKTIGLLRSSNYHERDRGLLDQSLRWQKFISGMQLNLPRIPPLPGLRANEKITAQTREYVVLAGDGHLYHFEHDIDRFEMMDILNRAARNIYPNNEWARCPEEVIGIQFGGNGNLHLDFAETNDPVAVLLDNHNFRNCFGNTIDFEITKNDMCCARMRNDDVFTA